MFSTSKVKRSQKLSEFAGSTQNVKKNVSRVRKKTFYLQFCMGTPEGHQKSIFNTSKV
jgi:hypothetical protein